ncbi:scarecrow-like protein 27 [Magnolia sinica]|uniref:scarecrow-like protein 27 n=1 Tax=Magnolia sinica TaxID=86752 RepID=UPI0026587655|nr:scarecrow-like protein 27 [Magnolia sinica]
MRATPFNLQGKGVLLETIATAGKWKKEGSFCGSNEPTSVLDTRRSPSPPTSTSTLSSSLGGGSGSSDTAVVAAVSDNPPHKWLPSQDESSAAAAAAAATSDGGGSGSSSSRKDEWASELQPIPASLEIGGAGGGEKCGGGGLGMDDWENMLSESAASPSNEQSFFPWFGDMDDPSLKQLLQSGGGTGGGGPTEFETGGGGFGLVDPGFGFESVGGVSASMNVNANAINPSVASAADFPLNSSNRLLSVQNPSHLPNFKGPCFVSGNNSSNPPNPIFAPSANTLSLPLSLPPSVFYQQQQQQQQLEAIDEKPQIFSTQHLINQQQSHPPQNPSFFLPLSYGQREQQHLLLPPQPKRHHPLDPGIPKIPFSDSGQELFLRRQQQQQQQQPLPQQQGFSNLHLLPHHLQQRPMKPKVAGSIEDPNHHHQQQQQQQQQALVDQLFNAAELVETGNSVHARGILARLNHQLSPVGKPLQRAAFYFKEALQLLLNTTPPSPRPLTSPFDVVFKISAYKAFSEISPFLQFTNFTSNQALLEVLDGFDRIHIIDFDIGFGGQWASFMQELPLKLSGVPSLKITAFASLASHDPLELGLTRENLSHFASDLSIPFEFNVVNLDSLDPSSAFLGLSDSEAVAVNLPVGSSSPSIPFLLRLVKQLDPKIIVSVDRGSDRSDLPFSHHFLHALQSYSLLLDSLDAANVNSDAVHKIERFLLHPRIESLVLGRHRAGEKMPPWRTLFASAGFSPLPFSNFTETQAECLVKRLQMRGFHVEKRQASLYLCWQRGDLVSVSAWRC